MNQPHDPLDELLQPIRSRNPEDLRERLRDHTSRYVQRRLVMRRSVLAGVVAASLLAIAPVGFLVWPRPQPVDPPVAITVAPEDAKAEVAEAVTPVDLEWQAFDSKTNRAAVYFEAGHQYLATTQDFESALRCYRQALDVCTAEELEIAPNDNWLVVTLKNARRKETVHE